MQPREQGQRLRKGMGAEERKWAVASAQPNSFGTWKTTDSGCKMEVSWEIRGACSQEKKPAQRQCWRKSCKAEPPRAARPLPLLSPAFSTRCHLPEVQGLKALLSRQAAREQEVAFGGALIRGENTTASPNWFSDSKL